MPLSTYSKTRLCARADNLIRNSLAFSSWAVQDACKKLVAESSRRWAEEEDVRDDITAIVVYFEGYKPV